MAPKAHITVCICTFKRHSLLKRLLETLAVQNTADAFSYSVVIADNDQDRSAEWVIQEFSQGPLKVVYCCEPRQNIALARNKTLENAEGDFVAFIDDDEFPERDWLLKLLVACGQYGADAVLGPVRPHFDSPPPSWVVRGRFCERPEYPTGRTMRWEECRTGNVLFRRQILASLDTPFKAQFGTGGEDKDFFMRLSEQRRVVIWCNEAVAYETVPASRCTRGYMLKRALLRGQNILKHPVGRRSLLIKSIIAVPIYLTLLPALLLFGQHWFMSCSIRLCDHLGRLLGIFGINPVRQRQL